MKFQKGHAKIGGRVKGTPNKKKVIRAADILAERGINPVEEILDIIPDLKPIEQIDAWFDLLSYCEAKPKEVDAEPQDTEGEDLSQVSTADLLKIVRKSQEGA